MGMVIKIYIGDIGQEVNIATLNSDKTQSVTITSKLIEDYRNKLINDEINKNNCNVVKEDLIITNGQKKSNADFIQKDNEDILNVNLVHNECLESLNQNEKNKKSYNGKKDIEKNNFNKNKSKSKSDALCESHSVIDNEVESGILNPEFVDANNMLIVGNLNKNFVEKDIFNDTDIIQDVEAEVSEINHHTLNILINENDSTNECIRTADGDSDSTIVTVTNSFLNDDFQFENIENVTNTNNEAIEVESNKAKIIPETFISKNNIEDYVANTETQTALNTELLPKYISTDKQTNINFNVSIPLFKIVQPNEQHTFNERNQFPFNGVNENSVIESLKNVSYNVDDFLNKVSENKCNIQCESLLANNNICNINYENDMENDPLDVDSSSDEQLEENFVVDKVLASRINQETNVQEFLLKLKNCKTKNEPWSPIVNHDSCVLSLLDCKRLFIQSFKTRTPRKKLPRRNATRKLKTKKNNFKELKEIFAEVPNENISNENFNSDNDNYSLTPFPVVDDPNKMLTDACIKETSIDQVDDDKTAICKVSDLPMEENNKIMENCFPDIMQEINLIDVKHSTEIMNETLVVKTTKRKTDHQTAELIQNDYKKSKLHTDIFDCSYKIHSKTNIETRYRKRTIEKYVCPVCDEPFITIDALNKHFVIHMSAKSKNNLNELLTVSQMISGFNKNLSTRKSYKKIVKKRNRTTQKRAKKNKNNQIQNDEINEENDNSLYMSSTSTNDALKRKFTHVCKELSKTVMKNCKTEKTNFTETQTVSLNSVMSVVNAVENENVQASISTKRNCFTCKICNSKVKTKASLIKHMITHTERSTSVTPKNLNIVNNIPTLSCSTLKALPCTDNNQKRNVTIKHKIGKKKLFNCSECGRLFLNFSQFNSHKMLHERNNNLPFVVLRRLPF